MSDNRVTGCSSGTGCRASTSPSERRITLQSHMVLASEGGKTKLIRFGQQGVKTNQTAAREAFKSRHAKNIKKGKMSAAYWANKVKWSPSKTKSSSKKWKRAASVLWWHRRSGRDGCSALSAGRRYRGDDTPSDPDCSGSGVGDIQRSIIVIKQEVTVYHARVNEAWLVRNITESESG